MQSVNKTYVQYVYYKNKASEWLEKWSLEDDEVSAESVRNFYWCPGACSPEKILFVLLKSQEMHKNFI